MPVQKLKRLLYNHYLKKKAAKSIIGHQPKGLSKSLRIGILFDSTEPANYVLVNKYVLKLKEADKRVEILGYFNFKHMEGDISYMHFCRKELSFYWHPNDNVVDYFIKRDFDILINAYTSECLPLEYISTLSHATYRIALFQEGKPNIADFYIKMRQPKPQIGELLSEIDHYLKMIKTHE